MALNSTNFRKSLQQDSSAIVPYACRRACVLLLAVFAASVVTSSMTTAADLELNSKIRLRLRDPYRIKTKFEFINGEFEGRAIITEEKLAENLYVLDVTQFTEEALSKNMAAMNNTLICGKLESTNTSLKPNATIDTVTEWYVRPGLAGEGYSFESAHTPGHFMCTNQVNENIATIRCVARQPSEKFQSGASFTIDHAMDEGAGITIYSLDKKGSVLSCTPTQGLGRVDLTTWDPRNNYSESECEFQYISGRDG